MNLSTKLRHSRGHHAAVKRNAGVIARRFKTRLYVTVNEQVTRERYHDMVHTPGVTVRSSERDYQSRDLMLVLECQPGLVFDPTAPGIVVQTVKKIPV